MLGRVMNCLENVFIHDGKGHPLYFQTFQGTADMGKHALSMIRTLTRHLDNNSIVDLQQGGYTGTIDLEILRIQNNLLGGPGANTSGVLRSLGDTGASDGAGPSSQNPMAPNLKSIWLYQNPHIEKLQFKGILFTFVLIGL